MALGNDWAQGRVEGFEVNHFGRVLNGLSQLREKERFKREDSGV